MTTERLPLGAMPDLGRPMDERDRLPHTPDCEIDHRPMNAEIAHQLFRGKYVGPCGCVQPAPYDPSAPRGYEYGCPRCGLHMGHTLDCTQSRETE